MAGPAVAPDRHRRLAAVAALVLGAATVVLAVALAVSNFPNGLAVLACLAAGVAVGWWALRRRGFERLAGMVVAGILVAGSLALVIAEGDFLGNVLVLAGFAGTLAAAVAAFRTRAPLTPAARPQRPVLFYNPKSGGGKAERFKVAAEAESRGITAIELHLGDDLETLVRRAVADGADALAMAGGDGSQAIVAAVAAETGLPYVCIPAGTRNHFALDLGVDRDDVVGALDALTDGRERVVDLAEINGRVFVNNVSLGIYADAVEREGYREAKIRTLLDTVPDVLGPGAQPADLHWTAPGLTGDDERPAAAVLVSNNRYRLGRAIGSGTRPRLDAGELGVAVLRGPGALDGWTAPEFEVRASQRVPAGIDGETVQLEPPLRFRIRPGALRVLIAPQHPGASPSAAEPDRARDVPRELLRIAAGRGG